MAVYVFCSFHHDHHVRPPPLRSQLLSYKTSPSFVSHPSTRISTFTLSTQHTMKRSADTSFPAESIALPSPPADSPSPAPTSPEAGPPRKRSRSEVTPEERKEARAHRNRIAAQNSRDRRKAQFTFLERRVAELEEENKQLRAGMGLAQLRHSEDTSSEQREREKARERENEELKERIKTLENGWDAVVKALAASGLPLSIPTPSQQESASNSAPPPPPTFPVIVSPSPVFPLSPQSNPSPTPSFQIDFEQSESTRHLARVANTDAPLLSSVPLQRVDTPRTNFSWNSPLHRLLFQLRRQRLPHTQRRSPPSTKSLWRISSGKSSRLAPPFRRRICLLVPPTKQPPKSRHRPPGPRR